jgi:hypothetical protein
MAEFRATAVAFSAPYAALPIDVEPSDAPTDALEPSDAPTDALEPPDAPTDTLEPSDDPTDALEDVTELIEEPVDTPEDLPNTLNTLPTTSRTFYVTASTDFGDTKISDGIHVRVFKYGRTPMVDGDGNIYGCYNGAGSGVVVRTNPVNDRETTDIAYSPRHTITFHIPSILANATREFALYPPTAFLALATLPVVRTYSIALYEYIFHQCCAALFYMYQSQQNLRTPGGVPYLLAPLSRTPLLDEPLKAPEVAVKLSSIVHKIVSGSTRSPGFTRPCTA